MSRSLLGIYLRGIAMGAADVVPGVSGGTIALITGIYDRLIDALKSLDHQALLTLKHQGLASFWGHISGTFLVTLLAGVVTSIALLASGISYLLDHHPVLVWSFFFGLITASGWHLSRLIGRWHWSTWGMLLLGIGVALLIANLRPAQIEATPLAFFLSGGLAICAMILPGISGSFILVLLGMYRQVLDAIHAQEWSSLLLFVGGCGLGLLLFSHLLSWLLHRFHRPMMALLTGFLMGSLSLVWPWKEQVERSGETFSLNVSPAQYGQLGFEPHTGYALAAMLAGVVLVLALDYLGRRGEQ